MVRSRSTNACSSAMTGRSGCSISSSSPVAPNLKRQFDFILSGDDLVQRHGDGIARVPISRRHPKLVGTIQRHAGRKIGADRIIVTAMSAFDPKRHGSMRHHYKGPTTATSQRNQGIVIRFLYFLCTRPVSELRTLQ